MAKAPRDSQWRYYWAGRSLGKKWLTMEEEPLEGCAHRKVSKAIVKLAWQGGVEDGGLEGK